MSLLLPNLSARLLCSTGIYTWGVFILKVERVVKNNDHNYLKAEKKCLSSQK